MAVVVILPPSGALRMACYNQQESDLTLPLLPPAHGGGRAPISPQRKFVYPSEKSVVEIGPN